MRPPPPPLPPPSPFFCPLPPPPPPSREVAAIAEELEAGWASPLVHKFLKGRRSRKSPSRPCASSTLLSSDSTPPRPHLHPAPIRPAPAWWLPLPAPCHALGRTWRGVGPFFVGDFPKCGGRFPRLGWGADCCPRCFTGDQGCVGCQRWRRRGGAARRRSLLRGRAGDLSWRASGASQRSCVTR